MSRAWRHFGWIFLGLFSLAVFASIAWCDDRILVSGAINDRPAKFALDTGAGLPFVALESKAGPLELTNRSPALAAQSKIDIVGVARAHSIRLFGKAYSNVPFYLVAAASPNVLQEFDALVGWPAVRDGVLRLELGAKIATFEATAPNLPRSWRAFSIVPADVLVLEAGSATKPSRILVDTGLDDGVQLGPVAWAEWVSDHRQDNYALNAAYLPGQGIFVRKQYFASRINVGTLVLHNVMVAEATGLELRVSDFTVNAVIGLSALRHLRIYVEGSRYIAHIREEEQRGTRQNYNRLGAVFVPKDGDFSALVAIVAPASPAAFADIRDGDLLVAVDGRIATEYLGRAIPFSSLWSRQAGTHCRLTVRRGDQVLNKDVTLKDYLD